MGCISLATQHTKYFTFVPWTWTSSKGSLWPLAWVSCNTFEWNTHFRVHDFNSRECPTVCIAITKSVLSDWETVLTNNITMNRIVPSLDNGPRNHWDGNLCHWWIVHPCVNRLDWLTDGCATCYRKLLNAAPAGKKTTTHETHPQSECRVYQLIKNNRMTNEAN